MARVSGTQWGSELLFLNHMGLRLVPSAEHTNWTLMGSYLHPKSQVPPCRMGGVCLPCRISLRV